jgi:hypothetical protein
VHLIKVRATFPCGESSATFWALSVALAQEDRFIMVGAWAKDIDLGVCALSGIRLLVHALKEEL